MTQFYKIAYAAYDMQNLDYSKQTQKSHFVTKSDIRIHLKLMRSGNHYIEYRT